MVYSFKNDYSEIAHTKVLEKYLSCLKELNVGYGLDKHTVLAIKHIKRHMNFQDCDVHIIVGGTLTNLLTISSILKPYEAVISCQSGHINVHETGAIEGCGNKVLVADSVDGKITIEGIKKVIDFHIDEHMVIPKLVYISNSTEIGTVYTKNELTVISNYCKENQLYLFVDGARLGSGLMSVKSDVTLNDLANLTDAFYIGGTKNGLMYGEALVLINDNFKKDFRYYIKHKGALLAKGFIAAIGFEVMFEDNLYFEIGKHENNMANILSEGLKEIGVKLLVESSTNQLFPIFDNKTIDEIKSDYLFEIWEPIDDNKTCIRLVTSFATEAEKCFEFLRYIQTKLK